MFRRALLAATAAVSVLAILAVVLAIDVGQVAAAAITDWQQVGDDIEGEFGHFAGNVEMSDDGLRVLVGATGANDRAGEVRVLERNGGQWRQIGRSITGDAKDEGVGYAIAISGDGNTFIVGASRNDTNGRSAGLTRVFRWTAGDWVQLGGDILGETAGDISGQAVAISADGSTIIIGEPRNDVAGRSSGRARVFRFTGREWTSLGDPIDGTRWGDFFGHSVAMSADGETVIVGAFLENGGAPRRGTEPGFARAFALRDDRWQQVGTDLVGERIGDCFGCDVTMSDDGRSVAVGATGGNSAGLVRAFNLSGGDWSPVGSDIIGEAFGDVSGNALAMNASGDTIIVGALRNDGNGEASGHARVFRLIAGDWSQVGSDIDGEAPGDLSGGRVAISADGNTVAVGALFSDDPAEFAGHVRIFDLAALECAGRAVTIDMNRNGGDGTGTAGRDVILGTPNDDVIDGMAGDDVICGGAGNDEIHGGDGDDRVLGERGADTIDGEAGDDVLKGNGGDDRLTGGDGSDRLVGGGDNDRMFGKAGDDVLIGGPGDDLLDGGGGTDSCDGAPGANSDIRCEA